MNTNIDFDFDFAKANERMHSVETEWHYPILTKAGFTSDTTPQQGFVRSFVYNHPAGHNIKMTTGVNADYWDNTKTGDFGYWADLQPHLNSLNTGETK